MARPRKIPVPASLDEREAAITQKISALEAELSDTKAKISVLKGELSDLSKEREALSLQELREAIVRSGRSVGDWLGEIQSAAEA